MNVFKNGVYKMVGMNPVRMAVSFKLRLFFCLLLIFCLLFLTSCQKQTENSNEPIAAELKSFVDKTEPAVGEEFSFTLRLEYPIDVSGFFLPDVGDKIKGLRIVEPIYKEAERVSGRMLTERIYRLVADVKGSYTLPDLSLSFFENGQEINLQSPQLYISVGGEKGFNPDLEGMSDIFDIVALEPGNFQRDYSGYWWLFGVLLLVLSAWFFWKRGQEKVFEQPLKPYEWAFLRIAEIEQANWLEKGLKMAYCVALSNAVRGYLKRAFVLPAEEYTLQQLLPLLKDFSELSESDCSWLREFMIESDRAKFANIFPSRDRLQEALIFFRDFVQRTGGQTKEESEEEEVQFASA